MPAVFCGGGGEEGGGGGGGGGRSDGSAAAAAAVVAAVVLAAAPAAAQAAGRVNTQSRKWWCQRVRVIQKAPALKLHLGLIIGKTKQQQQRHAAPLTPITQRIALGGGRREQVRTLPCPNITASA